MDTIQSFRFKLRRMQSTTIQNSYLHDRGEPKEMTTFTRSISTSSYYVSKFQRTAKVRFHFGHRRGGIRTFSTGACYSHLHNKVQKVQMFSYVKIFDQRKSCRDQQSL